MDKRYKKLFGYINLIEPPEGLKNQIMRRVEAEEGRLQTFKLWAFSSGSIASLGLSLWTIVYLGNNVKQTGFGQYLFLAFSENSVILSYWREITLSLIESLPIVGLIAFLISFGFFVWSISNTFKRVVLFNSFS